jgi:hypothetical protein
MSGLLGASSVALRPATLDDVPFMAALHAAIWREVYPAFVPPWLMAGRDETYRQRYWHDSLVIGLRGSEFRATIAEAGAPLSCQAGRRAVGPSRSVLSDRRRHCGNRLFLAGRDGAGAGGGGQASLTGMYPF